MSNTNTHVSREAFIKAWDNKCTRNFGLGYTDLPDILLIDDYWHDMLTVDEAKDALNDMLDSMRDEMGMDGFDF